MRNTHQLKQEETTIQHTVAVEKSVAHAFAAFVHELGTWWPAAYTWAQDVLDIIVIKRPLL